MKTAILLPGHFRTFKKTHKNFYDKFINDLEGYDIFISSWDVDGNKVVPGGYVNLITNKKIDINSIRKRIEDIYKPKSFEIEKNKDFKNIAQQLIDNNPNLQIMENKCSQEEEKYNLKNYLECVLGQLYKIQRCYEMIESPEQYDVIVKYRFDLKLSNDFKWNDRLKEKVFVGGKGKRYFDGTELWRDTLIAGKRKVMCKICHTYDHVLNLTNSDSNPSYLTTVHAVNSVIKKNGMFDQFKIITDSESFFNKINIVR